MTWGIIGAILSYTLLLTYWWISLKHLALAERVCRAVLRERKAAATLNNTLDPYEWSVADKAVDDALREWERVRG